MTKNISLNKYGIKRICRRLFFQWVYKSQYCPYKLRVKILRWCGVDIGENVYIGKEVLLDEIYPEGIHIGNDSYITQGTKIITHFKNHRNKN